MYLRSAQQVKRDPRNTKRDLQKRHTKENSKETNVLLQQKTLTKGPEAVGSHIVISKNTHKRDLQKRPTIETNLLLQQKRPTKGPEVLGIHSLQP